MDNAKVRKKKFVWKGKYVSEKVYNQRVRMQNVGKTLKFKSRAAFDQAKGVAEELKEEKKRRVVEGRRVIHVETLGEQLFCKSCKNLLGLQNIEVEERHGLASVFSIRCGNCKLLNKVASDKQHQINSPDQSVHFDPNTKIAIGK